MKRFIWLIFLFPCGWLAVERMTAVAPTLATGD